MAFKCQEGQATVTLPPLHAHPLKFWNLIMILGTKYEKWEPTFMQFCMGANGRKAEENAFLAFEAFKGQYSKNQIRGNEIPYD